MSNTARSTAFDKLREDRAEVDAKFRLPIGLMLFGLASCVVLLIGIGLGGAPGSWPVAVTTALFAVAGGVILLSGVV